MSRDQHASASNAEAPSRGPFTPRVLIDRLFSVAGPELAEVDLRRIIRGGAEFTELAARSAAHVAEGLGCLVAADGSERPGGNIGNFQDGESVAKLLWHMQAQWETVEAITAAIGWAVDELEERRGATTGGQQ